MRRAEAESRAGQIATVCIVIRGDIRDDRTEILLRERRHLAAVQRNIERHDALAAALFDSVRKRLQRRMLRRDRFCAVAEIAVAALHIACHRGHI